MPEETQSKKRGRPKIPQKWTIVLAIESDPLKRIVLPTIASEIELASVFFNEQDDDSEDEWDPYFHPKLFVK